VALLRSSQRVVAGSPCRRTTDCNCACTLNRSVTLCFSRSSLDYFAPAPRLCCSWPRASGWARIHACYSRTSFCQNIASDFVRPAHLAQLAYCSSDLIKAWNCGQLCKNMQMRGLTPLTAGEGALPFIGKVISRRLVSDNL
jgi:hypothetical protein